jgi:hypothetical protein
MNIVGTSNKASVAKKKDKTKHPKKKHPPYNNKESMGPKPSQQYFTPNGDKGPKTKGKKTERHCNFCGQDGQLEFKCLKNMESSKVVIKKHNINLDYSYSNSSSHGHALSSFGLSFNAISTSYIDE